MHIVTHPTNAKHLDEVIAKGIAILGKGGGVFIKPPGIEYSASLPATVPSAVNFYQTVQDKFVEHHNSDWELYFGFTKPVQDIYVELADKRTTNWLKR